MQFSTLKHYNASASGGQSGDFVPQNTLTPELLPGLRPWTPLGAILSWDPLLCSTIFRLF